MNDDMHWIVSHLNSLERENRRLRLVLCILVLPIMALLWMGLRQEQELQVPIADASPEVHAQRFVLVDSGGRERAVLGIGPNGPFLHFFGSGGASVPLSLDASGLVLHDFSGSGAALSANGLELSSTVGHAILKAQSLELKPVSSSAHASLGFVPDGPSLLLQDDRGSLVAVGVHLFAPSSSRTVQRTGAASIALVSPDHHILWSAPPPVHH